MAITANSLTSGVDETPATSFATASVAPGVNRLILVAVAWIDPTRSAVDPIVSGGGLTYDIATGGGAIAADAVSTYINLFRAMGSPSAAAITIDFDTVTPTACAWSVVEFDNVLTGANGATATVAAGNHQAGGPGTAWDAGPMGAFANGNNRPYACYVGASNAAANVTPEAGWTELHEVQGTVALLKLETCWNPTTADLTPTATGPNVAFAGISEEIGAVPTASSSSDSTSARAAATYYYA